MHRLVATVFKVLGFSIILMIIFDLSLVVVDAITVRNRIEAISLTIQDELARNNCIPNDVSDLFDRQLQEIVNRSSIAQSVKWNLNESISLGGTTYTPINEDHVRQYGEQIDLVIQVEMRTRSLMFSGSPDPDDSLLDRIYYDFTLSKHDTVPALRHLK